MHSALLSESITDLLRESITDLLNENITRFGSVLQETYWTPLVHVWGISV